MARPRVALLAAALLAGGPSLGAQGEDGTLGYTAKQLNCARFLETTESTILTQSGGRDLDQTSGRTGVWIFRATSARSGLVLEGWLESLALWRRSAETTIRPDTDGLVGGRYRGTLSRDGVYSSRARPFVPEEVAEVAGMANALDDFFPPLPPGSLHTGEVWTDSAGLRIQRMSDSALSGVPLYRFSLEAKRKTRSADVGYDTLPLQLHQTTQERGSFVWHPLVGLVKRERRIVVETTVPAGRSVAQAVRSKIEQRIRVRRDLGVPPNSCS
jgi:hypothetical protein